MIATLHHYALEVPDLEVAEGFLQDFGLETGEKDGSLVAQCPGRSQEQVRLVEAPAKRLHHIAFTLHPGTLDAVREALERSGTPVIDPPLEDDYVSSFVEEEDFDFGLFVQNIANNQARQERIYRDVAILEAA